MPTWLQILLQDFVMPEVYRFITDYANANNGSIPTLEQINASILNEANAGIAKGLAWLQEHGD